MQSGALRRYLGNIRDAPRDFLSSLIRHGQPTSDRAQSQTVFSNLFLHILPTRIHRYSLRIRATFGLGVISLALFFLLVATGIPLMIYYKPSVDQAGDSMKEIQYIVPTGRFVRNIHRWSAHAMAACVMPHMGGRSTHRRTRAVAVQLGSRHGVVRADARVELYRLFVAVGSVGVLGNHDWFGDCSVAARADGLAGHHVVV
jgi:hypothetical protein